MHRLKTKTTVEKKSLRQLFLQTFEKKSLRQHFVAAVV